MGLISKAANIGRKFMTAYAKKVRPKTSMIQPMSDEWRAASKAKRQRDLIRASDISAFPKEVDLADNATGNAIKKHYAEATQRMDAQVAKRQARFDAGYDRRPNESVWAMNKRIAKGE
jgi:hypothetical protein